MKLGLQVGGLEKLGSVVKKVITLACHVSIRGSIPRRAANYKGNKMFSFYIEQNLHSTAVAINKPHEDGMFFVETTAATLEKVAGFRKFYLADALNIHAVIFRGRQDIPLGTFRSKEVTVGGDETCIPFKIAGEIDKIFPVTVEDDLIEFYTKFQKIHPFEDGNGRVGGVIVAALSFAKYGVYLAPNQ